MRLASLSFLLSFLLAALVGQAQQPQFVRDHIYGPRGYLILTAEPDTYPPTAPTNLGGGFDSFNCVVNLSWNASTDIGSGVSGYTVYRNGTFRGTSTTTSFTDSVTFAGGTYTYTVKASDTAGNISPASSGFTITTSRCSAAPVGRTITPDVNRGVDLFALSSPTEALPRRPNILDRLRWLDRSGQLTVFRVML